ncbi:hypothetical protein [Enterococcus hermanniensis]|nr:hypothetical protein [Enterococcus hermanniensis]
MGLFVLIASYQAIIKYPTHGLNLLNLTSNHNAYSPTVLLSTLTAGAKSVMYFINSTTSMLKRKKQRKQLLVVIGAVAFIYFLPIIKAFIQQFI